MIHVRPKKAPLADGKIPLWANMQIITSTGTKNAIIRPSLGFSTGTVRRFFLHVSGILSGISSRTVSSIFFYFCHTVKLLRLRKRYFALQDLIRSFLFVIRKNQDLAEHIIQYHDHDRDQKLAEKELHLHEIHHNKQGSEVKQEGRYPAENK